MRDAFKKHLHGCVRCTGGLYCPMDRPLPTSSAGARRLRLAKKLSRRSARRILDRTVREELDS